MDPTNKRKIDIWEDDWEKEVAVDTRRRPPPSKAAAYTAILEQQNEELSETCNNLESTLAFLTTKLDGLKSTLLEEQAKSRDQRQQRQLQLKKPLETARTNFMRNQSGCLGTLHENQQDLNRLLFQHQVLSATLNRLEAHCESSLPSLETKEAKKVTLNGSTLNGSTTIESILNGSNHGDERVNEALWMAKLIAAHNVLEDRYMHAKAETEAYQAGAQVLEKEIKKMNSLPQIVPILEETTEQYQKEILHNRKCQDNLPLSEMIQRLGNLRIRTPLLASMQMKQNRYLHQIASRLKKIHQGLLWQRANQQVLTYSYEVEMKHLLSYKYALEAYRNDLLGNQGNEVSTTHTKVSGEHSEQQEMDTMARIKQILATYQYKLQRSNHPPPQELLDPQTDYTQLTDDQVVKTIEMLVDYEAQWNKNWSEDINDNLDAIQLLDQSKQNLSTTLFGDSVTRDTLEIKPKSYDDLQWTLEATLGDLRNDAGYWKKKSKADDQIFQERRDFVSLFFTEPFAFETKMDAHLDSLARRKSVFDPLY